MEGAGAQPGFEKGASVRDSCVNYMLYVVACWSVGGGGGGVREHASLKRKELGEAFCRNQGKNSQDAEHHQLHTSFIFRMVFHNYMYIHAYIRHSHLDNV